MKPILARDTKQKRAIRETLLRADRPLAVEEVHAAAAAISEGLSLPTVYRSIRAMIAEGWLTAVELPGRAPVYETAERDHHHHFSCARCGRVFELAGCAAADVELPSGFVAHRHEITVVGVCGDCAEPPPRARAPRRARPST